MPSAKCDSISFIMGAALAPYPFLFLGRASEPGPLALGSKNS